MSDTVVADVLDAVYDLFAADTTLAALVSGGSLRLSDGPPTTDWAGISMLVVGGRVVVDDEDQATTVEWDWESLGVNGASAMVEQAVTVPCAISTRDGSTNMRTTRRTAINVYKAAAAAARGSTLLIPQVMWCIPTVSAIRQMQSSSGAECLISFSILVRTSI